jgi:hypothetical protein
MKASDLFSANPWLQLLIYGDSGSGKTTFGARCPAPLIMMTEQQALPSIAVANPNASVVPVSDYLSFGKVIKAINRGKTESLNGQPAMSININGEAIVFQTLVIDSLTDLHTMISEFFKVDEEDKFILKRWGQTQKEFHRLMGILRSLPINLVCLCLVESTGGDNKIQRRTVPALYGKAPEKVGQYFSGVGYSKKSAMVYKVLWNLGDSYVTKRPPTTRGFPDSTSFPVDGPGLTLGSMLLGMFPGVNVAHNDDDSAEYFSQAKK